MAGKVLLNLTEITSTIDDDLLYVVRGVGADRDKKIKIQNLNRTVLSVTGVVSIDLSTYGGDLVLICTASGAGYAITFSNYLNVGKKLTILNTSAFTLTLAGTIGGATGAIAKGTTKQYVSSGSSFTRLNDSYLLADTITEATSGSGVTIEGVLLKDNAVEVDEIKEKTPTNGVLIDGVLLKDESVSADKLQEKNSGQGIDVLHKFNKNGYLINDSNISGAQIRTALNTAGFTDDGTIFDVSGFLNAAGIFDIVALSYDASANITFYRMTSAGVPGTTVVTSGTNVGLIATVKKNTIEDITP